MLQFNMEIYQTKTYISLLKYLIIKSAERIKTATNFIRILMKFIPVFDDSFVKMLW
jgi:hypothetical protein